MKVFIIGAGPTGVCVAKTLREEGFQGSVTMFSSEPFPPYSPPVLADYLETDGESKTIFWEGEDFCEKYGIDCFMGRKIISISPQQRRITDEEGHEYEYDILVIASGSKMWIPIRCECEKGSDGEKFYNFKSLSAVRKLMKEIKKGASKAVIIGAGFIGIEIAITLRKMGLDVTVVEMMDRILPRMVNKQIAAPLEELIREMGIKLRLNSKGELLKGKKKAEELILSDGQSIKGEIFVAATGIMPNVDFLKNTGIPVRKGIVVDEHLRAGFENIFAGGDVAEVPDLITGNVYPHAIYPEAVKQGQIIAMNILGKNIRYEGGLNMNSLYHFGLPLISEGAMEGETEHDREVYLENKGKIERILLKEGKILRFELVGDKKPAGLLHSLLVNGERVNRLEEYIRQRKFNFAVLTGIFWRD